MLVSLSGRALYYALGVVIGLGFTLSAAAKDASPAPEADVVDLFAGVDAGKVEATVIPRDAKRVTLQLKNNSDKPLAIRLPEAFAAVPVQAQFGGGGGFGNGGGGFGVGQGGNQGGGQGGAQGLGVGGGGQNGGVNGGGGRNRRGGGAGPGIFNVPVGKVVKVRLTSVCLEYGKPEPNAHHEYAIAPIETLCDKPEVVTILRSLSSGQVSQEVAQLAAWNVANGTSFEQLATMKSKLGLQLPVYSQDSLTAAAELVAAVKEKAKTQSAAAPASTTAAR